MKYKNILVTGGLGFIGTNFINFVLKKRLNINIFNVDKMTYASNQEVNKKYIKSNRYKFYKIDIRSKKIEDIIKKHKIDLIINFAAESHVDNSIKDPKRFYENNVGGVINLLSIIADKNIRFHQVSTDEVFGSLSLNSKRKFEIYDKYDPSSPYSASKASADIFIKAFAKTYGINYSISYCSNNYGKYQNREKLIPKIIESCLNRKKIPIYGTGSNIRDWIYVDDHCEGIFKLLSNKEYIKEAMFGGNTKINNLNLTKKIIKLIEKKTKAKNLEDLINFVQDRKGHDLSYQVSIKSAEKIKWKPKVNIDEGLNKTVSWYVNFYLLNQS